MSEAPKAAFTESSVYQAAKQKGDRHEFCETLSSDRRQNYSSLPTQKQAFTNLIHAALAI